MPREVQHLSLEQPRTTAKTRQIFCLPSLALRIKTMPTQAKPSAALGDIRPGRGVAAYR